MFNILQLSSINEETRECGCASLANIVASTENIKTLLQKDCIKILAPLFVDPSPQVSVKALGAVRSVVKIKQIFMNFCLEFGHIHVIVCEKRKIHKHLVHI